MNEKMEFPENDSASESQSESQEAYERRIRVRDDMEKAMKNARTSGDVENILDFNLHTGVAGMEMKLVLGIDGLSNLQASSLYELANALQPGSTWTEEHSSVLDTFDTLLPEFASAIKRAKQLKEGQ